MAGTLTDFHFLRPLWLLGGLLLPLWWWASASSALSGLDRLCDAALLPFVRVKSQRLGRDGRGRILAQIWLALAVLALAGPSFERLPVPVFRNLSPLVLVVDLSYPMRAADLKPSRLERVRFKLDDLLRGRRGGQSALVVYAGDAFTVTPLTDDAGTLSAQLDALSPDIMPVQGNQVASGLEAAKRLIHQAGERSGDVLLVTTGGLGAAEQNRLQSLHEEGIRVSILGVGTPEGAPIPLPGGGFLREPSGRMALSRLEIQSLWEAAKRGGGVYRSLSQDGSDVADLLSFLSRAGARSEEDAAQLKLERWKDAGFWLLPPLVILGLIGLRRASWFWFVLVLVMPWSPPSHALSWTDLWKTPDQQGKAALEEGDAKKAQSLFLSPEWKSAAAYRAGDFTASEQLLKDVPSASAHYNRGNALARAGRLEEALSAYDEALKQQPADADTLYNQSLVKEALKKAQPPPEKNSQKDQNPKDSGQNQGEKTADGSKGSDSDQGASKPNPQGNPSESPQPPPTADDSRKASEPKPDAASNPDSSSGPQGDQGKGNPPKTPSKDAPGETPDPSKASPTAGEDTAPKGSPSPPDKQPGAGATGADDPARSDEMREIEAQWLRSIPDDPGGLLKRKFYLQYQQRQGDSGSPRESK